MLAYVVFIVVYYLFVRFVPICEISCSIKSNSMFLSALRAEIFQIFPNLTNHEMLADVVFVVVTNFPN